MWAAGLGLAHADAFATAEAVAPGIPRAAALRLVASSRAAEAATADRIEPVAATPVAFEADTFGNRRLGGARKDRRPGIATPRGLGIVQGCSDRRSPTDSEQGGE